MRHIEMQTVTYEAEKILKITCDMCGKPLVGLKGEHNDHVVLYVEALGVVLEVCLECLSLRFPELKDDEFLSKLTQVPRECCCSEECQPAKQLLEP